MSIFFCKIAKKYFSDTQNMTRSRIRPVPLVSLPAMGVIWPEYSFNIQLSNFRDWLDEKTFGTNNKNDRNRVKPNRTPRKKKSVRNKRFFLNIFLCKFISAMSASSLSPCLSPPLKRNGPLQITRSNKSAARPTFFFKFLFEKFENFFERGC